LRRALLGNYPLAPTFHSDRYELGVLIHEIVLLTHPASGYGDSEDECDRAMLGPWLHDPLCTRSADTSALGYPVTALSSSICGRFREVFGREETKRPTARDWAHLLNRECGNVHTCIACGGQYVWDSSRSQCPFCLHHLSVPSLLVLKTGRQVRFGGTVTVIGRGELGGHPTVSAQHATFQRNGTELCIISHGKNGSYKKTTFGWVRLPNNSPVPIHARDRLKLADMEVEVRS
jgi:hypothetical protein